MQTNYEAEQLSMFDQDLWYGKMFPVPLVQERQRAKTSESFWRRSSALSAIPFQSLDLTPGAGNLLGEFYWELISPWRGGASTLNTGVSPKDAKESSLSQILQADPPLKYYLSPKACLGILRRKCHVIQPGPARFPRRFAPRNDKSEVRAILAMA